MSQENVDLVRAVLDGWARGDFRASANLLADNFEWIQSPDAVEPGSHRGAAVGDALRRIFEVFEHYRITAEQCIDAGPGVFVAARAQGTARGSGLNLDQELFMLWRAHEGLLLSAEFFNTRAEALEAVGLSE